MSNPGGVGTGIDINSVGAKVGRTYSTMAKDHDLLVKSCRCDVGNAAGNARAGWKRSLRRGLNDGLRPYDLRVSCPPNCPEAAARMRISDGKGANAADQQIDKKHRRVNPKTQKVRAGEATCGKHPRRLGAITHVVARI